MNERTGGSVESPASGSAALLERWPSAVSARQITYTGASYETFRDAVRLEMAWQGGVLNTLPGRLHSGTGYESATELQSEIANGIGC